MTRGQAQARSLHRLPGDRLMSRRDHLRLMVTLSGGLLLGSAVVARGALRRWATGAPARRVAGAIAAGEAVAFSYPGEDDPALAVRLPDGALVGYASACTHLGCPVLWTRQSQTLECPCHKGVFEARSGEVLAGPPPRPLPRIRLEERHDGIYATEVTP